MKKYLLVFYLLIIGCMSLKAEPTRQTVMIINGIKSISGFAATDSILFKEMRFSMMNVPIDSLDFSTIIKTVEKQKAVVSSDVYFALNYVVFSGLYNRFGKRDNSKAIDFGLQLIEKLKKNKTETQHELLMAMLYEMRYPFRISNRINEGVKYFFDLAVHYQNANDSNLTSICYNSLASFYRTMGLIEKAIYYQKKSIAFLNNKEIKQKRFLGFFIAKSPIGVAGVLNRKSVLAQMYSNVNKPAKALALLYENINQFNALKEPLVFYDPLFMYLQTARAKSLLQDDSVDYYFSQTQKFLNDTMGILPTLFFYQEKGAAFLNRDIADSAEFYFLRCMLIKDMDEVSISSGFGNLIPEYFLAQQKLKKGNFKEAKELLLKAIPEAVSENQKEELLKDYKLLAYVYKSSNDFKNATHYFELENILLNQIRTEEDANRSITFEIEQSINQNELNAIKLSKENERNKTNMVLLGLLSVLIIAIAIVLFSRYRLKRKIEMEKMRSRISRDLHDDIGSTLSSINIISNMAHKHHSTTDDAKTHEALEKINERSQRLLDNMSDIVWSVKPENDTMEEILSRMRLYASTILEAKGINYTINFPTHNVDYKLSLDVKNNLYLIFKEAVNNLAKYSRCNKATLSLNVDDKNIHLKIQDDGVGFNMEEVKHRGGLINMRQRAEEIKGTITVSSEIGKGTAIELTIPAIG